MVTDPPVASRRPAPLSIKDTGSSVALDQSTSDTHVDTVPAPSSTPLNGIHTSIVLQLEHCR